MRLSCKSVVYHSVNILLPSCINFFNKAYPFYDEGVLSVPSSVPHSIFSCRIFQSYQRVLFILRSCISLTYFRVFHLILSCIIVFYRSVWLSLRSRITSGNQSVSCLSQSCISCITKGIFFTIKELNLSNQG